MLANLSKFWETIFNTVHTEKCFNSGTPQNALQQYSWLKPVLEEASKVLKYIEYDWDSIYAKFPLSLVLTLTLFH